MKKLFLFSALILCFIVNGGDETNCRLNISSSVELMLQGPFKSLTQKILDRAKSYADLKRQSYETSYFGNVFFYIKLGADIVKRILTKTSAFALAGIEKELFDSYMLDVKRCMNLDGATEEEIRHGRKEYDYSVIDFFCDQYIQNVMADFLFNEFQKSIYSEN
jgi:hypothetical protein